MTSEKRKIRLEDLSYGSTTKTVKLTKTPGTTTITLAEIGLSTKIDAIVNLHVKSATPPGNVSVWGGVNTALNGIGLTVYGASGSTINLTVLVMGV